MNEKIYVWRVYHSFDKIILTPGESVQVRLEAENLAPDWIYIGAGSVQIPWFTEPWRAECRIAIPRGQRRGLLAFDLAVPESFVGQIDLGVALDTWLWWPAPQQWFPLGDIVADGKISLWAVPTPRYRAFVSRSLQDGDVPIGDQIISMIQVWGFETYTVGYNLFAPDPSKIPEKIREEIIKSDCLIAIATPRDLSGIDFMLRTFTWLHGEAGMAFLANKPVLVLVQEGIKLEGLITSETFPKLRFSPLGIMELYYSLPYVMPAFRQWIADAKRQEFLKSLVDFVGKAGLGVLIGYTLRLPPE